MNCYKKLIMTDAHKFIGLDFYNDELEKFRTDKSYSLLLGFPTNYNCNLNCKFCFTDTHINKGYVMSFEERRNLLYQAKEIGIKTLVTAGSGECFCDKDFIKLLEEASFLGFKYILFTNLTMIDYKTAVWLKKNNVSILGSCHSINKDTFQFINGNKYSFDKMMIGIENLLSVGYKENNFAISCVVCKANYDEIIDLIKYFNDKCIKLYPEYANISGAANRHFNDVYISFEQYKKLLEKINKTFPGYNPKAPLVTNDDKCFTGEYGIIVNINGDYANCFDPGPDGNIANIKTHSLREAIFIKRNKEAFCDGFNDCSGRNLNMEGSI